MDWGVGEYELTATELLPFADLVVAEAAPRPGDRVLDLGCGTGNVSAVAVATGAEVVGIDPSERLVGVARERVPDAELLVGSAEDLPFEDASFDVVISLFAVIFTPDPERAMAEIVRVLKPGGRALITSWVPAGPIDAGIGTFVRAAAALSPKPPAKRFAWGDADEVRALAERHGAQADVRVESRTNVIDSPDEWIGRFAERHPMGIPMAAALEQAGQLDEVRARAAERMREGAEQTDEGLAMTTSALITTLTV
jgi:SAM-dependent methyltransferase